MGGNCEGSGDGPAAAKVRKCPPSEDDLRVVVRRERFGYRVWLHVEAAARAVEETAVAGWGGVSSSGPQVRDLLAIKLAYVDRDTCNKPLAFDSRVSTRMICAGATAADACGADSGGALSTAGLNPVAYGIVSWGGDCQDGRYGVYTRVSFFSKWVDDCVNGRASCRRRR